MSNIFNMDKQLYDSLSGILQSGVRSSVSNDVLSRPGKIVTTQTLTHTMDDNDMDTLYRFLIEKDPSLIQTHTEKEIKQYIKSEESFQFKKASRTLIFLRKYFSYQTVSAIILLLLLFTFIVANWNASSLSIVIMIIGYLFAYVLYGFNRGSYPLVSNKLKNGIEFDECNKIYDTINTKHKIHNILNVLALIILIIGIISPILSAVLINNNEKKAVKAQYNELKTKIESNNSQMQQLINEEKYSEAYDYVSLADLNQIKEYENSLMIESDVSKSYADSIRLLYNEFTNGAWAGDSGRDDYPYSLYYFDSSDDSYISYVSTGIDNESSMLDVANEHSDYIYEIRNRVITIETASIKIDDKNDDNSISLDCSKIKEGKLIIQGVEYDKVTN